MDSTRSLAAQLIAVRTLRAMSSQDVIRALTLDFDLPASPNDENTTEEPSVSTRESVARETQSLLTAGEEDTEAGRGASRQIATMSALEIAIVAEAQKFLAAPIVQGVVEDIWKGNAVLWGDLDINASTARKKPTIYAWRRTMWAGYARLRVPRYRFAFQVANFSVLLVLFLATLVQPDRDHISAQEIFLDIWFLGFAYAELGISATGTFAESF